MASHMYLGQVIVIALIVALYKTEFQQIIDRGKIIVGNKLRN